MSSNLPAGPDHQAAPQTPPPSQPTSDEPRSLCIEDWLTVIVMAALALITFANVIVRYFTSSSFAWTEEISVFLMIVLALVAGSAAVARDRHIRIEFFSESGSAHRRRRLAQLGAVMVALLFTLIAVLSIRTLWDDYRFEETSPGIGVPVWWYTMWLPILSIAIALRAVGLFVRRSRQSDAEYLIDATVTDAPMAGDKQP
ncbi:TRAP transporter small permease [Diaphorobacter aerolatus]|uniref:TRAP transporter small permease protein n=1 Tax=Diaphorobacter aerolatus TaxID=1288495 RepID=A0A7H0GNS1_9BURK|nr:TRAP transporter small permease [Diaphorobacter aerolatus]QNP49937.1 TRAP transporter small permease [Diaphorobacter aerolatus]